MQKLKITLLKTIQENRNNDIAFFAEELAEFYFPKSKIEPIAIAKAKDISVSHGTYSDAFDALLVYNDNKFHVELNLHRLSHLESTRARFSFGHELGHYFIDEHRTTLMNGGSLFHVSRADYESDILVEREADHFASNLLMPTGRFLKMAGKIDVGFAGILSLSEYFGASITSCAIKYLQAEIRPCMILKWNPAGELEWKFYSKSFYEANLGTTLVKGEAFGRRMRSSPTDNAIQGIIPASGKFFHGGSTIGSWFPKARGFKNDIIIEEAFPLGDYGILTLLFTDKKNFTFTSNR